ncbi:diacylglycerol/lipid kinase family protein [Phenylobacterium sp.]|jgi:diacylglycerol kinase family enzyme|uniref:diacylglycerol/lipid kinase family protein n=1 Tax=Phenylobacterium sp. TaxID=1871053 RepID=UPI002E303855|nr:diacylglycerol kinase family protein [Phenylobacterium sp.]HEX2559491.1 diacylglycerol kinase family protein [Phenylobacterium sp.]
MAASAIQRGEGARLDLRALRIGALLNTSSGSCDLKAEEDVKAILESEGLSPVRVWCGGGADVDQAVADSKSHELDLLIVLGGDGTIRAAAEACGSSGPLLMPLPGGTMNMLPKALYGDFNWREALKATLADPQVQPVHGADANGHRFFIAAILGGPSKMAEAREAMREHDLAGAVEKGVAALRQALTTDLRYRFGNRQDVAESVAVLCPLTSRSLSNDEEVLEAAAFKVEGAGDALRLAWNATFRDWREDPTVERAKVRTADVESDELIPALLDGETFEMDRHVHIELAPDAFRALRPADAA